MADADPANVPKAKTDEAAQSVNKPRRRALIGIGLVVLVGALLYGVWAWLNAGKAVTTDNAYVGADSALVTPMLGGQVIDVRVSDTQSVHRGDVLAIIDDSDARIALAQAEAALVKARREFTQSTASERALGAQVSARGAGITRGQAQLASAQADLAKAQVDLARRQRLAPSGAVSGQELTDARTALRNSRAAVELARAGLAEANSTRGAAQSELEASRALTDGVSSTTAPDIRVAQARVDQARLELSRAVVKAPIDGVVTSRRVQVGQRIAAGTTIMSIVPVDKLYVDANFKEGQLARVKPGQRVTLTSDLYGANVVFHGRVIGLAGGTGASTALIPAQNATGNWIKVVQRLPIRIALDPKELKDHPLRVGLSMATNVDLTDGE